VNYNWFDNSRILCRQDDDNSRFRRCWRSRCSWRRMSITVYSVRFNVLSLFRIKGVSVSK